MEVIKVSVIIPVYNVEAYVEECLQSVIEQTLKEIEIVCINDKSTDSSWDKVKQFAKKDKRFILLENEENKGLSYSRNRGLDKARGEYVYMLDSDDTIQKSALEELYKLCQTQELEVVSFEATLMFEDEAFREKFSGYRNEFRQQCEKRTTGRDLFILSMEYQDWVSIVQRFFYKRDFLKRNNIQFLEGILHEDEAFTFEVMMKASAVRRISKPYFNRRFRSNSIMTSKKDCRDLEGYLLTLWRVYQIWNSQQKDVELNRAVQKYAWQVYQNAIKIYLLIENQMLTEGFESNYEPVNIFYSALQGLNMGPDGLRLIQGEEIYQRLKTEESVYIYGAGIYARRAIAFLDRMQIAIKGLIVDKKEKNPRAVCGIKVYELEEIKDYDELVIIGVSNKYKEEVKNILYEKGFSDILELKF